MNEHQGTSRQVLFFYTFVGRGGDAVQVQAMLEAIRRLGFAVEATGAGGLHPYAFNSSVNRLRASVKRFPWWAKDLLEIVTNLLVAARIAWRLRRHPPALIIERMTPYGLGGVLLSRILGVPLVLHLDAPFETERTFRNQPMFTRLHRSAMCRAGQASTVIAVGSYAAREHYTAMGMPAERFLLLQNGVFADEVVSSPTPAADPPVIGFVGSLARWHRVDLLLQAVASIQRVRPVRLTIIGMGEDFHRLEQGVRELGIENCVQFLGPKPRSEVMELMRQFQVAVLPHTLATGAPMKLFEYAAQGVPAVAPDLPNLRQIWGQDRIQFFQPEDPTALAKSVLALLDDRERAMQMAARAATHVRRFYTWEYQMRNILHRAGVLTH